MKELVSYIVKELIEDKESFNVEIKEGAGEDGEDVVNVYIGKADIGRVIGKQGRIAKAIRVIVRAAGTRVGKKYLVEIIEK